MQLARTNTTGAAPTGAPAARAAPAAVTAPQPGEAAPEPAASLEEIAACAALLARMAPQALRSGPAQKISAGHVEQLSRRLEALLACAGFSERDRLWDCLVRPGSASPGRFLAAATSRP